MFEFFKDRKEDLVTPGHNWRRGTLRMRSCPQAVWRLSSCPKGAESLLNDQIVQGGIGLRHPFLCKLAVPLALFANHDKQEQDLCRQDVEHEGRVQGQHRMIRILLCRPKP